MNFTFTSAMYVLVSFLFHRDASSNVCMITCCISFPCDYQDNWNIWLIACVYVLSPHQWSRISFTTICANTDLTTDRCSWHPVRSIVDCSNTQWIWSGVRQRTSVHRCTCTSQLCCTDRGRFQSQALAAKRLLNAFLHRPPEDHRKTQLKTEYFLNYGFVKWYNRCNIHIWGC